VLRAVRWKALSAAVRPDVSIVKLIAPTVIGFTGLALLGRPGELIRPYLIAKQEKAALLFPTCGMGSRANFDIGVSRSCFVLVAFFATAPKRLEHHDLFEKVGLILALITWGSP